MASPVGDASTAVIERLENEPWKFDFFAAVLWIERLNRSRDAQVVDVADSLSPAQEEVRFRSHQSRTFAPSDLVSLRRVQDVAFWEWELAVAMMGLTGPNGVMPAHYSRLVNDQVRKADRAQPGAEQQRESSLPEFLDLFNHRQISLFYRAWKKYRLEATYRPDIHSEEKRSDDPITMALYSLVGLANNRHDRAQALQNRSAMGDECILFYAGAFSRWPRSPVTLRNIVSERFDLVTQVLEFQPQWSNLRPQDQYRMAPSAGFAGNSGGLGQGITIGSRICLYENRFRVRLGPISRQEFDRLLPEGDLFRPLVEFVRLYVGAQWDFDIQLVLKASEVPATRLGGPNCAPSQLARNSWSINKLPTKDQDQVVLNSLEFN